MAHIDIMNINGMAAMRHRTALIFTKQWIRCQNCQPGRVGRPAGT